MVAPSDTCFRIAKNQPELSTSPTSSSVIKGTMLISQRSTHWFVLPKETESSFNNHEAITCFMPSADEL